MFHSTVFSISYISLLWLLLRSFCQALLYILLQYNPFSSFFSYLQKSVTLLLFLFLYFYLLAPPLYFLVIIFASSVTALFCVYFFPRLSLTLLCLTFLFLFPCYTLRYDAVPFCPTVLKRIGNYGYVTTVNLLTQLCVSSCLSVYTVQRIVGDKVSVTAVSDENDETHRTERRGIAAQ